MIIVCSGPDTYRAREKARELQVAFKQKHDPSSLSSERIDGSEGLPALLSRLAGASLFASKKMLRADGCLAEMRMDDVRILASRLAQDSDQTIIVTVEEKPPVAKVLEILKPCPLFHYPYPLLDERSFREWVRGQAKQRGVPEKIADRIAEYAAGDSWQAVQELVKQQANPQEIEIQVEAAGGSIFETADAVMAERPGWRSKAAQAADPGLASMTLNQLRSYLKIKEGFSAGIHPYVAKKMKMLKIREPEKRFKRLLRAFIASRSSLASEDEVETLF